MQNRVLTLFGSKTVQDGGFVQDGGVQDGVQHGICHFCLMVPVGSNVPLVAVFAQRGLLGLMWIF